MHVPFTLSSQACTIRDRANNEIGLSEWESQQQNSNQQESKTKKRKKKGMEDIFKMLISTSKIHDEFYANLSIEEGKH